ncbi:MAG: phenylalanine--tRNA ligase subunit beta [Patescibacteria group bacterium]
MRLSLNWLKDFIDIKITPEKLAEKLTLSGTAVDSIEYQADKYEEIIIAEIQEIKPHPNADKLRLAIVNDGQRIRQIVCGAPNIKKGQKVPLALPGAKLPSDLEVKEVEIRGKKSEGMICSQKELGVGDDHSGILILPEDVKVGESIVKILNLDGVIFDLALTANRGDCYSIVGIAREVSALLNLKLKMQNLKLQLKIKNYQDEELKVDVKDIKLCPKYCALVVRNVKVKESPEWLKRCLMSVGIRPINNIVDITNYVMMEIGQPMHAFDKLKVKSEKLKVTIGVRKAKKDEILVTLDGQRRQLDEDMLVITDGEKPIALAGVMGGAETEVSETTKDIILEAAIFDPVFVRQTYRRLNLRTEASIRFEKGIDWFLPEKALARAGEMIQEIADGQVAVNIVKSAQSDPEPIRFNVDLDYINKILGRQFKFIEIKNILESLGIELESAFDYQDRFMVKIPSWRHDLKIPADIAEEVGRIYDYNQFTSKPIRADIYPPARNKFYHFKYQIRKILHSLGYNEIYTYSFYGNAEASFIFDREHIEVQNPISSDQQFLRHSLFPLILRKASMNLRFFDDIKIFELGAVFKAYKDNQLPCEETVLAGALSIKHKDPYNLYRIMKGGLEYLLKNLGIAPLIFEKIGQYIDIKHKNKSLGQILILDEKYKEEYKIRQSILLFQLNADILSSLSNEQKKYAPIPGFPSVIRDLSFIVPQEIKYQNLINKAVKASTYIKDVSLIDEYYIDDRERSLTIRVAYRSDEKTLEGREVDKIEKEIIAKIELSLGVKLRC